jgi:triosephosphate isomerase
MKQPVFVANWKMNHGPSEAEKFVSRFLSKYKAHTDRTVVIVPPAASLSTVVSALGRRKDIMVGVQNIHTEAKGAFTGETSAEMARDAGAKLALVGHSERRHVFGETDEATAIKCARAFENGLTPLLCVGETIQQRDRGEAESVVLRQLRAGMANLKDSQPRGIVVAYEPVWAIGTGRTATPADADAMHEAIRAELTKMIGVKKDATKIPILYGGSVTAENVRSLLEVGHVDGVLVGGASIDPNKWNAICST